MTDAMTNAVGRSLIALALVASACSSDGESAGGGTQSGKPVLPGATAGDGSGDGDGPFDGAGGTGDPTGTGADPGGAVPAAGGDGDGDGDGDGQRARTDLEFDNPTGSTVDPDAKPNPMGDVDYSYIWVANSSQGTVSKIDTRTLAELGRYLTSPNGTGLPSRTSVAADGNVAVANRGLIAGGLPGDGGGVIKIYAHVDDCVDTNGNGTIETSTGAADIKPWNQDECVAWFRDIPEASNRPVAWAPPPAPDATAKLWTAGTNSCLGSACTITVYRLNGDTGVVEDTIPIAVNPGPDFITGTVGAGDFVIGNYGPYGAASDAGGNVWLLIANTTQLIRVDAVTLESLQWPVPMANGYGITIDSKGRVFLCGTQGVTRFDPQAGTFMTSNPVILGFNGCMTDGGSIAGGAETLWVGGGADLGTPGLHAFDTDTLAHITSHNVGTVKGVSIDVDGFVWGVSGGSTGGLGSTSAWRLNPNTGDVQSYDGLVGPYSYSDMTGFGLQVAGFQEPKIPN